MLALCFDTETTGLPKFGLPPEHECQPHLVQLAWAVLEDGRVVRAESTIVSPLGWTIPPETTAIHGISNDMAMRHGMPLRNVLERFELMLREATVAVAHNIDFDRRIVTTAAHRDGSTDIVDLLKTMREEKLLRCTMQSNVGVVESRFPDGRPGKWPRLAECHTHYFGKPHESQHDALGDVQACARVFLEMERRKVAAAAGAAS